MLSFSLSLYLSLSLSLSLSLPLSLSALPPPPPPPPLLSLSLPPQYLFLSLTLRGDSVVVCCFKPELGPTTLRRDEKRERQSTSLLWPAEEGTTWDGPTPGSIWWDYNTLLELTFFPFPSTKNNSVCVGGGASQRQLSVQTDSSVSRLLDLIYSFIFLNAAKHLGPIVEEFFEIAGAFGRIQAWSFLFRRTRGGQREHTHTRTESCWSWQVCDGELKGEWERI